MSEQEKYYMKQAKPDQEEIVNLSGFFQGLEEILDNFAKDSEIAEFVKTEFPKIDGSYMRCLWALSMLIDNCCDPSLSYLDWKPKVKEALNFQQLVKQMRSAQKAYFKTRTKDNLIASKELEKQVDEFLKEMDQL